MFERIEKLFIGDYFDIEKCYSKEYPKGFFVIINKKDKDNVIAIENIKELKSLYENLKFLFEKILG